MQNEKPLELPKIGILYSWHFYNLFAYITKQISIFPLCLMQTVSIFALEKHVGNGNNVSILQIGLLLHRTLLMQTTNFAPVIMIKSTIITVIKPAITYT